MSKKIVIIGAVVTVLAIAGGAYVLFKPEAKAPTPQAQNTTKPTPDAPTQTTQDSFNKQQYAIDTPASPWWVVNKQRPLPTGYAPTDLVVPNVALRVPGNDTMQVSGQIQTQLESLFAAMKAQGYNMYLSSGFRSYAYQQSLYGGYVAKDGQAAADRYSARPGTSEHQTGMAFDIGRSDKTCELEICFGETPEGQWIQAHAHEYGFIIRYPENKESITGYQYEPWHLRYVGVDLATEMKRTGVTTLEEFFDLPPAPTY